MYCQQAVVGVTFQTPSLF